MGFVNKWNNIIFLLLNKLIKSKVYKSEDIMGSVTINKQRNQYS
jgi:hypothetical protein